MTVFGLFLVSSYVSLAAGQAFLGDVEQYKIVKNAYVWKTPFDKYDD